MLRHFSILLLLCVSVCGQITNINFGTTPDDRTGDNLRKAGSKINTNTAWLASQLAAATNASTTLSNLVGITAQSTVPNWTVSTNLVARGTNILSYLPSGLTTPHFFGGTGDAATSDTAAVSNALKNATGVILPYGSQFLVAAFTNLFGKDILGNGKIVMAVTNGANVSQRQINTRADDSKYVAGREYLSEFHKRLMAGSTNLIVFSGDSTTAGDGTTTPYRIWELVPEYARRSGLRGVTGSNRGQSGQTSASWISTYLSGDLALNPNVMVVRWGINDPYFGITLEQTISNIRSGLATIRASYSLSQMSIVLCSPSSTSDSPNGRDARYYELLAPALRQAARDYQCVFVDLYSWCQDSFNGSNWMDNPYADGRYIHPLNVGNLWYSTILSESLFPSGLLKQIGETQNINVSGTYQTKSASDGITAYEYGVTQYRAVTGWPWNGIVVTHKFADGTAMQINYPYDTYNNVGAWRIWKTGSVNAWGSWLTLGEVNVSGANYTAASTDLPTAYPQGYSLYRATTGFPSNGEVWTSRHIDGSAMQFNWGYQSIQEAAPWFRFYYTDGGGAWNAWQKLVMQDLTGKASVSNLVSTNIYAGGLIGYRNQSARNYERYAYKGAGYASGSTVDLFSVGSYGLMTHGTLLVRAASSGGSSRGIHTYTLSVSGGGEAATITATSYQQYGGSANLGTLTIVKDTPTGGTDTVRFTVGATALTYLEWVWTPYYVDSGLVFTEL